MLFELTNEQRYYLGLTQVEDSWEKVKIKDSIYIYFDGDKIVKLISITETTYQERELNEMTAENRTVVLPKTAKGKKKKLNYTAVAYMRAIGVYFAYGSSGVVIGNYSTQTTFYSTYWEQEKYTGGFEGMAGLRKWLDFWINDTTDEDMKALEVFRTSERQHCKFKEGDFFVYQNGRRQYGFGRILLDVTKVRKAIKNGEILGKHYGLKHLMGKALIIKVFKKTSHTMDADIDELKQCDAYLSQAIMDNVFLYGEYKILGNLPLEPSELEFPISFARSINYHDQDTVYLQYGLMYKEKNLLEYRKTLTDPSIEKIIAANDFKNEYAGFEAHTQTYENDLRHPKNAQIKRKIFMDFGLDADKSYLENYEEYINSQKIQK